LFFIVAFINIVFFLMKQQNSYKIFALLLVTFSSASASCNPQLYYIILCFVYFCQCYKYNASNNNKSMHVWNIKQILSTNKNCSVWSGNAKKHNKLNVLFNKKCRLHINFAKSISKLRLMKGSIGMFNVHMHTAQFCAVFEFSL